VDGPEFDILPDSDTYDRERFSYPLDVRFRRNRQAHQRDGLDFIGVTVTRGQVSNKDGATPNAVYLRMRHTGGELEKGDSVVLYAAYGERLFPVGWFPIRVVAASG
jgi:hypothetical protein